MPNNLFSAVLEAYLSSGHRRIVQIGANDGAINDPIYEYVMRHHRSNHILLIEPQENVIAALENNYKDHQNATILKVAIGASPYLKLYRLRPKFYDLFERKYLQSAPSYRVPTGFTSSIKQHVVSHISGNLPRNFNLEDAIEEINVECVSLLGALRAADWAHDQIDILQIDAEGSDYEVLLSCNLDMTKPSLINFEHFHLSASDYRQAKELLLKLGYQIYSYSNTDTLATTLKFRNV